MRMLFAAIAVALSSFALAPSPGAAQTQTQTQTAAADYERQCSSGDSESCWVVGRWYKGGIRLPLNKARASALLKRSCDLGYSKGCSELADMERSEKLANPVTAVAVYDSECSAGKSESCIKAAEIYNEGAGGVAKDMARVAILVETACKAGNRRGCVPAAQLAMASKKPDSAIQLAEAGCTLNDGQSCDFAARLAVAALARPDPARALNAAEKGCALKDGGACLALAMLYRDGRFLPTDAAKSRAAAQSACDLRNVEGCKLAYSLASTTGESLGALNALCVLKVADACAERGRRFEEGDGAPSSSEVALRAYRAALAIDPNHAEAKRRSDALAAKPSK